MINTNKITMPCGEIGDTNDLKSLPFMKCHLESAQGTLKINNQKKINEFNDGFFILIFIIKLI